MIIIIPMGSVKPLLVQDYKVHEKGNNAKEKMSRPVRRLDLSMMCEGVW